MNYIKRLEREVDELSDDKREARQELDELWRYLQSSKFHDDPTVQVADVMHRLMNLRLVLLARAYEKGSD